MKKSLLLLILIFTAVSGFADKKDRKQIPEQEQSVIDGSERTGLLQELESEDEIEVKSSQELLEKGSKSNNKFTAFFANVFKLVKNIPFSIDIGTEGALHGNNTYYSATYKWTPSIYSYCKVEMKNTLENYAIGIYRDDRVEESVNNNSIDFIPFEHHLFFNKEKNRQFSYGIGINGTHQKGRFSYKGWNFGPFEETFIYGFQMGQVNATGKIDYFSVSPLLTGYFKIPLTEFMVFNSETSILPISFFLNRQKAVHSQINDDGNLYRFENSFSQNDWNNSEIRQSFHLDFFNFFAVVANFKYAHNSNDYLYFYMPNIPNLTLKTDTFTLKVGGCLISVGKTFVRLKTGIFYEHEWEWNSFGDGIGSFFSSKGQVKISLGVDY